MNQPPHDGRPGQPHNPYDPNSMAAAPDPTRQFPTSPYGGNPYAGNPYDANPYAGDPYGGQQQQQQFGRPYGAPNPYGYYGGAQQPGGPNASSGTHTGLIIAAIIGVVVLAVVAVGVFFAMRGSGDDGGGIALPATSSAPPYGDSNPSGLPRSSEPFAPSEPSAPSTTLAVPTPTLPGSGGPGTVRLEATSSTGSEITVTYIDADLGVQQESVPSPWSTEFTSDSTFNATSLVVVQMDEGEVTCKIFVDDEEVDSKTASGAFSMAECAHFG
ncbi:MAG TPA: hypothetical protein K8V11_04275 [Dietzia timorensis]|uniref:MmpS family membrane protein n=1 Tax=Dietzia timorensis TaxID=499555 RepID=A0A921F2I2_9ACTN|nr:MmpS family transport accessory protein [Dietzia timorensis]HJE90205.1 hypothetical protein [Dietzia timorensis]